MKLDMRIQMLVLLAAMVRTNPAIQSHKRLVSGRCTTIVALQSVTLLSHLKKMYPDKAKRPAKFTSFAFGKVVTSTIPKRLALILLAFLAEHWVFIHVTIPLSYVATGVICFEQFWSILENEASCRDAKESRFWKILQKITIDKTERHFDVELDDLKKEDEL